MCNSLFRLVGRHYSVRACLLSRLYLYVLTRYTAHECESQDELLNFIISVFPLACALSSLYEQLAVLDGCPPFL